MDAPLSSSWENFYPPTSCRRYYLPSIAPSQRHFIAEQLLLMSSDKLFGNLNTEQVIEWAKDSLFADMPDPLEWWDGSGLSATTFSRLVPPLRCSIASTRNCRKKESAIFFQAVALMEPFAIGTAPKNLMSLPKPAPCAISIA